MKQAEKRGATGSGYALTVGLISIVALGAVTGTGNSVIELFGGVGDTLIEVTAADLTITPGSASSMNITSGPVPAFSSGVQFVVKNTGNSPTAALTTSLTNATDFVIDSDGCTGLQLGSQSSCGVTVSMTAVANGSYTGTLRVGGGAKFVEAPLSGTAIGLDPASLSVDQPLVSGMDVVGPGSPATGTPVTLTFTNDGEIATGSLTTSNDNATNFAISSDSCNGQTLAGGATCSLQVTPQASSGSGSVTATVSIGDGSVSAASGLSGNISGFSLFTFTSHVFTNCGQTGRTGPVLSSCRSAYSTDWDEDSNNFAMPYTGYQMWTVPEDGTYRITAIGASGGDDGAGNQYKGGHGASIRGDFALTEGEKILMVVGQRGGSGNTCSGGGGASYVAKGSDRSTATIMLIAGAGGGAGGSGGNGYNAPTGQTPTTGHPNYTNGSSGNGGYGGGGWGGGGAGFIGNGNSGSSSSSWGGSDALSYRNGANGGDRNNSSCGCPGTLGDGGFGGGGIGQCDGGGGGGGYNGASAGGGGGGSYTGGSNPSNSTNVGTNHGSITIQKL